MTAPRTMAEKIWDDHAIGDDLLFIDLHLVHEVSSPQAFEGLRLAGRGVRRVDRTLATADHNVPTTDLSRPIEDPISKAQLDALTANVAEFGIPFYGLGHARQGIVHVIGPELGVTQPGMTIVCGDSHTSTHGAFGALAFGIGTSEVEHVLATQTLVQKRSRNLRVTFDGLPGRGVGAKDLILGLIAQETSAGATGYVVEYAGEAIRALSMEGRMTVSNMSIEWGARAGLIAPDDTTFAYLEGRPGVQGPFAENVARWSAYRSDADAEFDRELRLDAAALAPQVTWGTNPGQTVAITGRVPEPRDDGERRALEYMGLTAGYGDGGSRRRSRLHRLVHEQPHRRSARGRGGRARQARRSRRAARSWCPGRCASRPTRRPRASIASSPPRASSGATPAARCAWA